MGSSVQVADLLAREPGAGAGVTFARYMELALFHPEAGYYARDRQRVGRARAADFYTATSLGPVFGELVVAATVRLLGIREASAYAFMEIGAEPGSGVLDGVQHPFARYEARRLGDSLQLPTKSVVFSNELFDAQPFHRLIGRQGCWRELGVAVRDERLVEVELPTLSSEVTAAANRLPVAAPEGYHLDLPLRSATLLRQLSSQEWSGLFLAFDYGRSWQEMTEAMPAGSARAFHQQSQSNDLLAHPGEQDLTCDVCWDWLVEVLGQQDFATKKVESQEAFLTRHAGEALAKMMTADAGRFTKRKQAVMHLLHPAHMGQKFQVLHALRD